MKKRNWNTKLKKRDKNVLRLYYNSISISFIFTAILTLLYFFIFTNSYTFFYSSNIKNKVVQADGKINELNYSRNNIVKNKNNSFDKRLLPCGIPVGIYLESRGILVAGLQNIKSSYGNNVIPAKGVLYPGDYILEVDGRKVTQKEDFCKIVSECNGKKLNLKILRDTKEKYIDIQPVASKEGWNTGLWLRDDIHGIGTLTWINSKGDFAALGHCISDIDTGKKMETDSGQLYQAEIYSLVRSHDNSPGSLTGAIDYRRQSCIGQVYKNTNEGIFGNANPNIKKLITSQLCKYYSCSTYEQLWEKAAMLPAREDEIQDGAAKMLSCFNGTLKSYDINIKKLKKVKSKDNNMDMEINIIDQKLLNETGGILQGMSGSPIIQNGKIVGAVTHVFVSNPKKGYGIFIQNMLE